MALAANKIRVWDAAHPQYDEYLPVKAAAVIFEGALLMFSTTTGTVAPLAGATVFAGIAMEAATGGAADGDVFVKVRTLGAVEAFIVTDTVTLGILGVAATFPEATDDDTIRIETGVAITGSQIGRFARVLATGAPGVGKVVISIKGNTLA